MEFIYRKYRVKQVYTLEKLAKEVMERMGCSKEHSKEVIKRMECSEGCNDSDDEYIS